MFTQARIIVIAVVLAVLLGAIGIHLYNDNSVRKDLVAAAISSLRVLVSALILASRVVFNKLAATKSLRTLLSLYK